MMLLQRRAAKTFTREVKYNIVRLILSSAKDRYEDAKESFESWRKMKF